MRAYDNVEDPTAKLEALGRKYIQLVRFCSLLDFNLFSFVSVDSFATSEKLITALLTVLNILEQEYSSVVFCSSCN